MEVETTRDVLAAAALHIDYNGVSRSVTDAMVIASKRGKARLLLHALHAFATAIGLDAVDDLRGARWEVAPDRVRQLCERIWAWEDQPERTAEQIVWALAEAWGHLS